MAEPRYEAQEINPDSEGKQQWRITDKTTDSRIATSYVKDHADLIVKALNFHDEMQSPPESALAKTLADLITPKQLVAIRAIASAMGLKGEDECQRTYGCHLEEISRVAASALIDDLKSRNDSNRTEREQWNQSIGW